MSNELNEKIFRSVDTIVSARLQNLPFDQTIVGTIISVPENDTGTQKYMVDYKGAQLTVFVNSENVKYAMNEEVYVLIPQGDFTARKIITGRVINDYKEQGTNESDIFLPNNTTSYLTTSEKNINIITTNKEQVINLVQDEYESNNYKVGYTTLQVAFNLMADLYSSQKSVSAGTYGIIVSLNYIDQNTLDKNPKKEELKIKRFSCDEMLLMNKYRSGGYTSQKFTIDIGNWIITKVSVSAWYDNQFVDTEKKSITSEDEIFFHIKDLKISYGYLKSDFPTTDDSDIGVYLYSLNRLQYKSSEENSVRTANLAARAINKITGLNIPYQWTNAYLYIYNKSDTSDSVNAGVGWSYALTENVAKKHSNMEITLPSGAQNQEARYKLIITVATGSTTPQAVSKERVFTNLTFNNNIFLLAGITMTPHKNNNTFYSYGQDNQLLARSDGEQIQRIAVEYNSQDTDKLTTLAEGVNLTYYIPKESTMILPVEESSTTAVFNEVLYYVYNKVLTKNDLINNIFYIPFKIASLYSPTFKNNTIKCEVEINDQTYSNSLDLLFGTSGSSGANYILVLELQQQEKDGRYITKKALPFNDTINSYRIHPILYDYTWQRLDLPTDEESKPQFNWYDTANKDMINQTVELTADGILNLKQPLTSTDNISSKLIIKMTGMYQGSSLTGYLAIPVSFDNQYVCADGCSIITYDITGKKPIYEKTPYKLYSQNSSGDLIAESGLVWELLPLTEKLLKLENNIIWPPTVYSKPESLAYVQALINRRVVWIQPIIMINNTYPVAMWSDVQGREINFESSLKLLSTTVGQLNSDQRNGVLMGTFLDNGKERYGLYAFADNKPIFYINDNQEAYIENAEVAQTAINSQFLTDNAGNKQNVGDSLSPVYFSNGVPVASNINTTITNLQNTITSLQDTIINLQQRVALLEAQG